MKAIEVVGSGEEARLVPGETPEPKLGKNEIRVAVHATAVNRADLMQRRGFYPPPAGASEILGLEASGRVSELGAEAGGFSVGDRVMALLSGGGYAEELVVDAGSAAPVPECLSFEQAAAMPEVFLTCYLNLFMIAGVREGDQVLVHGGGSGIGTAAIQLLRAVGAHPIVTAGSQEKCDRCLALGAEIAINYREGEFAPRVEACTSGRGVDVILDSIGGPYLTQHLRCLRVDGRLLIIGLMGGAKSEVNLGVIVAKRLRIIGSTLRTRSLQEKAEIMRGFLDRFGSALERGDIAPQVDRVLPLEQAQQAHELIERSDHFGKVVLKVR
jgi:putative PIG3 family NAD(P)H quinone oxidoreductase